MNKFALWFIRTFFNVKEIIPKLVDVHGRKWCERYHFNETRSWFNCGTYTERLDMVNDFHSISRHDDEMGVHHIENMIKTILYMYNPYATAERLVEELVSESFTVAALEKGFVKRTASLTNIVKSHCIEFSANDTHLIVALLRKRVEE